MSDAPERPAALPRFPTGIPGLDQILGGGLFRGGIYIVAGLPGAGKTTLANQIAFEHARGGGRVVYATLLSETHGRLLSFLRAMSFFDPARVGDEVTYLNGYGTMEKEGLAGFLDLVRSVVREREATLLVVDGMLTASALAESEVEYKKFIQQLQSWIEVVGCTALLLTSAREAELRPEYTMVDGIIELEYVRAGYRRLRELTVGKLRGSGFHEGRHAYEITGDGVVLYPRVESVFGRAVPRVRVAGKVSLGIERLDELLGGGFARGSSALLLGASGVGKTTLGLHFLAAGVAQGERGLAFTFYETPPALLAKAERFGLALTEPARDGPLQVEWRPAAECLLDRVGHEVIEAVKRFRAQRLFLDGLEPLRAAATVDRIPGFLSALTHELGRLGVTSVMTMETSRLLAEEVDVPVPGVSGIVENIVALRQVERGGDVVRFVSVLKTREGAPDRAQVRFEIAAEGVAVDGRLGPVPPRRKGKGVRAGRRERTGGRGGTR